MTWSTLREKATVELHEEERRGTNCMSPSSRLALQSCLQLGYIWDVRLLLEINLRHALRARVADLIVGWATVALIWDTLSVARLPLLRNLRCALT
jgi:hypothetical protein